MDEFEALLAADRAAVERFVRLRISIRADADDVLQEIYLTAYQKFSQLKNSASFKPWLLSIARSKCGDYFREKAARLEVPSGVTVQTYLTYGRHGVALAETVRETLDLLGGKDRQILDLYYWKELPQAEIAKRLGIPVGTVKSRLHTARRNFRDNYPHCPAMSEGACVMKKLPEYLPEYRIEETRESPFSVVWEELMGWFLVPKLGEALSWGMYDIPSRRCSHVYDMKVTGRAKVHGIEGVELTAREASYSDKPEVIERVFVAQLTDTHCRYLATMRNDGDVRNYITFLDEQAFMPNWGFGEDNVGNATHLSPKGDVRRRGTTVTAVDKPFLLDIVGRYWVTIGGRRYDTVCVMDVENYNCGVVSEQFLDRHGRTILWRRFNRDDWAVERYHERWSKLLPGNERLLVNGVAYVHWYDCITDYIL